MATTRRRSVFGGVVVLLLVAGALVPLGIGLTKTFTPSGPSDSAGSAVAPLEPAPSQSTTTPATKPGPSSQPVAKQAAQGPVGDLHVVRDVRVDNLPVRANGRCADAFEPIVATHPTDPNRIAVAYQRFVPAGDGRCHLDPVIAISHDRGRTWRIAPGRPWLGSDRFPDHHSAIAWGPGPRKGSARLYWADAMAAPDGGHLLGIASSDTEGRSWSHMYIERRTPPWVGGFPDITVDRNPRSPDRGVVYAAYNWLADRERGPGLRVLASSDFGRTWHPIEIPAAPGPPGFGAAWRIAYRIRTAPDGAAYVSWYQVDLHVWDSQHVFAKGGFANVGRLGFAVAPIRYHRATGTFTRGPGSEAFSEPRNAYTVSDLPAPGTTNNVYVAPGWCQGFDVDPRNGRVYLAVGVYGPRSRPDAARGQVRVGRSDDNGRHWAWTTVPALPRVQGRPQSAFRPSLVATGGKVFVAFHGITDVPPGTSPDRAIPTIGTSFSVSFDGGRTFSTPRSASRVRWNAASLEPALTGPGLRDRGEALADGSIVYAYGDGRLADPPPDPSAGRSSVFAAIVAL